MTSALAALILSQAYVTLTQDGGRLGQAATVNCIGPGVVCSRTGTAAAGVANVRVAGGQTPIADGGTAYTGYAIVWPMALSGQAGAFSSTLTGLSWVTASSRIVCGVLGTAADNLTPETILLAGLTVVPSNIVAGAGFDANILDTSALCGTVRVQCLVSP